MTSLQTTPTPAAVDSARGTRRPRAARLARAVAGAALIPGLAVAAAAPAAAHDELVETAPAAGRTLTASPDEVALTFSAEPISGQGIQNLIEVTDEDGTAWQDGTAAVEGDTLSVPLRAALPDGEYRVDYRVVYSDGHTAEDSYTFTVDAPGAGAASSSESAASSSTESAAPASASAGEATTSPAASASASAAPDASPSAVAASPTDAARTAEQDEAGVPGWVWAAGAVGIVVIAAGLAVLARRARSVGGR